MGTVVPQTFPEIEDGKWYGCHLDSFLGVDAFNTCEDPFEERTVCCRIGAAITLWYALGYECITDPPARIELCQASGFSAQRLINTRGPYDTENDCLNDN